MSGDPVAVSCGLVPAPPAPRVASLLTVPDPFETQGEAARFFHSDLPTMPAEELAKERMRARWKWSLPDSDPWWGARVEAVELEISRRRAVHR